MGSGDFNAVSSSRRRTGAKIEHRVSLRLCAFLEGGRIWGAGAFEHGRSPVSSEGRRAGTFSCSKSPLLQVRLALGCLNWRRMKLTCSGGFKKTCFGQLIVRAIPPGFPRYRARIGSTILKKATNSKTLLRDKTVDFTARMWYNTGAKWKWTEIRRSFAPKLRVRTLPCALVVVSIRADSYYMQRRCGDRDNISQSLSARGVWISTLPFWPPCEPTNTAVLPVCCGLTIHTHKIADGWACLRYYIYRVAVQSSFESRQGRCAMGKGTAHSAAATRVRNIDSKRQIHGYRLPPGYPPGGCA